MTDAELRELFERKAQEMELRNGMPDGLARRVRLRQGMKAVAAGAVVAGLVVAVVSLTSDPVSQNNSIPPASEEKESPTTAATDGTLTFTGDECVYTGTRAFSGAAEKDGVDITLTLRNESSVPGYLNVAKIPRGTGYEELIADWPVIESATSIPPAPPEVVNYRGLYPGDQADLRTRIWEPGRYGLTCMPWNGEPALPGALLRVDE